MKILKIKKGFITNSSGSYEWLPTNTSSAPSNSMPVAPSQPVNNQPSPTTPPNNTTHKPYIAPTSSGNNTQRDGLDPSVILLGAIVTIAVVVAIVAEVVKKFLVKIKKDRKNNDHN